MFASSGEIVERLLLGWAYYIELLCHWTQWKKGELQLNYLNSNKTIFKPPEFLNKYVKISYKIFYK
jgi:hypothetical protein